MRQPDLLRLTPTGTSALPPTLLRMEMQFDRETKGDFTPFAVSILANRRPAVTIWEPDFRLQARSSPATRPYP